MTRDELKGSTFIEDERIGQYRTKRMAYYHAKRQTQDTGRKHYVCLAATYRDFQYRVCWTVCLDLRK